MLLIVEIVMLIAGLWAIATGKIPSVLFGGGQYRIEGRAARLLGILWNVYLVQGQPLQPAFEVFQRVWGHRPNPPAITLMFVSGLGTLIS